MVDNRLFLIDAYSIVFRAYYAIQHLTNSKGFPTNAVFGFIKSFSKIKEIFDPVFLCSAYDSVGTTFRKEIAASYKANRVKAPDDLKVQFPVIEDFLSVFGIPALRAEGYEADDVIASLKNRFHDDFDEIIIITGDKDLFQLIDDKTKVYDPKYDKWYSKHETFEKFGVYPHQMRDYLALIGDSSDNIRGAQGIGPKTAAKLLEDYGTIENIFHNLDSSSDRVKNSLSNFRKYMDETISLINMKKDIDIDMSKEDLRIRDMDKVRALQLFTELEFNTLINDLETHEIPDLKPGNLLSCKYDTIFFKIIGDQVLLLDVTSDTYCKIPLNEMNFSKDITYISYDVKDGIKILMLNNMLIPEKIFDIFIAYHVMKGGKKVINFNDMNDIALIKQVSPENEGPEHAQALKDLYNCRLIHENLVKDSEFLEFKDSILEIFEFPLIEILAKMELDGFKVDYDSFIELKKEYRRTLSSLEAEIFELCGETFNIDSPKQLSMVLFNKLGMPTVKKIKTGFSTDNEVLMQLLSQTQDPTSYRIIKGLLEYREIAKILYTYLEGFEKHITKPANKIHTKLLQTSTSTGRLASENPNLQNIPIKTERGALIRKIFIPSKEKDLLLSFDYSQIELVILANLSEDPGLINSFNEGLDIHSVTASSILSIPLNEVDKQKRTIGKTINFGIMYGMGAYHLSQTLGMDIKKAADFIERYYEKYKKVKMYQDELIEKAKKTGYVETYFGRRRFIPELLSKDKRIQQAGVRAGINAPIQGTASEIVKLAMIKIKRELPNITLILQIHDELLFEGTEEMLKVNAPRIKMIMENIVDLKVKLRVDHKIGNNWLEVK